MKRTIMMLALFALAGNAHAQRVYKCADKGQTIYQTVPCPPEQDTGVTRPITRDPNLTWADKTRAERNLYDARRQQQVAAGRYQEPVRGTIIDGSVDPEQCEDLKTRKEIAEIFGRKTPDSVQADMAKACAKR